MTPEELGRCLGRIEAKQDMLLDMVKDHMDDDDRIHEGHRKRIGSLEQKSARQTGLVAGIALVISTGAALLSNFIKGT